jgi:hypothetical protein
MCVENEKAKKKISLHMKEPSYKYTEMQLLYKHTKTQNLYQSRPTVDDVNSQYAGFSVETFG